MASIESERLSAFIRSRGGGVHEEIELFGRSSIQRERGVFAVGPIERGELLLRLPRAAVICACENGEAECGWMPEAARAASPMLRTAFYLMREHALGELSAWAPYLRMLPEDYDTLEHWSQAELAALRGTSVHDELSGLRDKEGSLVGAAELLWAKEIRPMVTAHPTLWPDASLTAFLRACAAVRTRGFFDAAAGADQISGPYLLPAIDMLNHARAGQATSLVVERGVGGSAAGAPAAPSAATAAAVAATSATASTENGARRAAGGAAGGAASGPPSDGTGGGAAASHLIFSMTAERDLAAGEEVVHTYDHFSDAQLLLTYGFVSSEAEAALPTTAQLPLGILVDAARTTAERAAGAAGGSGRALPWDARVGWDARVDACTQLLRPYSGRAGVSAVEPLPDALLTVALLLLMPHEDLVELLSDGEAADDAGGGETRSGGGAAGDGTSARVPMLDSSVLEGEPLLAAAVVEALVAAVASAEGRYAPPSSAAPSDGSAATARRLATACTLVDAERAALSASRRAAMKLLVDVGFGEDDEGEEEEEGEGEDEDEEDGEEDEDEDDEDEEDEDDESAPPASKQQRR